MEKTKDGETAGRGDLLNGWGKLNGVTGNYTVNNGSIMGDGRQALKKNLKIQFFSFNFFFRVWKLVLTGGPCGGKTTAQVGQDKRHRTGQQTQGQDNRHKNRTIDTTIGQ